MTKDHPPLDSLCGEFLTYGDFICCSDTWKRLDRAGGIDNVPRQPDTWASMRQMAVDILDPVRRHFGKRVILTYGFSGPALAKALRATEYPNITPGGDQHAGSELNRNGNLICKRKGIAVDFYVVGTSSWEVAKWIVEKTPFDRLYFYSAHRPFHVSVGPDNSRSIVFMRGFRGGPHQPVTLTPARFLEEEPK